MTYEKCWLQVIVFSILVPNSLIKDNVKLGRCTFERRESQISKNRKILHHSISSNKPKEEQSNPKSLWLKQIAC